MSYPFDPDWVVAPAETLKEWLQENLGPLPLGRNKSILVSPGSGPQILASMSAPREQRTEAAAAIQGVLNREPLTENVANLLQAGTKIPARFWLALEHNYRVGLAAGKVDASA